VRIGQHLFKRAIGAWSSLKLYDNKMTVRIARSDVNLAGRHNAFAAPIRCNKAGLNPVKLAPDSPL
jgi:hypothetical protein